MRVSFSVKAVLILLSLALAPIVAHAKPVWIDVRTEAEHRQSHIDGDPLIGRKKHVLYSLPDRRCTSTIANMRERNARNALPPGSIWSSTGSWR